MQTVRRIPYYGSLLLLAYMPFHVFLSQSLSLVTGGLDEWKVAKDVFLAALSILTIVLVWWERRATRVFNVLVVITTAYAILMLLIWVLHPHIYRESAVLGATYDLRLFCYTIVGLGATLLTPINLRLILKMLLVVSGIVTVLGIAQYFLPSGILTHAGYSVARGVRPNFFIDNNLEFPRIMSTLRDPNSLGSYLLLPIGLLLALLLRARNHQKRLLYGGALIAELVAVYLTFSRSAWAGTAVIIALVIWWQYRAWFTRQLQRYWPIVLVLFIVVCGFAYTQRNNPILTHQTSEQVGSKDSNQYHLFFVEQNLKFIREDPFGHGPGTAGLASIHNPAGADLTENYYLQIGYELGILGLAFFIAMQILLYIKLWPERHSHLGLVLLTSFWAYLLINMLLQEWDNEAVAVQWWLLAGLVLGHSVTHNKGSKAIR
jgi:O-antigen ligase